MSNKLAKLVVAAVAGAAVLVGVDVGVRALARADVAAFLEAHPTLHVAEFEASPLTRAIVLRGIDLGIAGDRVSVGKLRIPTPRAALDISRAEAAAGAAAALSSGAVQAEDVIVTHGSVKVRLKRIDLAGTKLTNADLAALLDAKTPETLEARLSKLTATAVVIPEIAIDDPTRGAERHVLVKKVLLADVNGGKASAFSAAETSAALTSSDDAVNGTTGGIEAANADLSQIAHILSSSRKDESEPIHPLFDKLQINTPKLANVTRGGEVSAKRIAATAVGARPLDQSLVAASAVAIQGGSSAAANALLLDDITQCLTIDALDIDDATSQRKAGDDDAKATVVYLGLRNVGTRGIGSVEMRDMRLESAYARLAVGRATLGPVPVPGKAVEGDKRPPARPGQVDLSGIEVDITPRDRPASQALRFKVQHAAFAQEGGPTAIPATGAATIDKLTFEASPEGAGLALYEMGYHEVSLSAALTSTYDAGAQELTIRKLSVKEPTMGSAEIELRLSGVSQDLLSTNAETAQAAAIGVVAKQVDLKLADAGLTERVIALRAKRDGMSVAEERAFYIDLFAEKLPTMLGQGAGVKAVGAALAKFIAQPKTLHIAIGSKDGLGVGAIGLLGDPAALLETLEIRASAND